MNNMIEVSFRKGLFNVIASIELATRETISGIKGAINANKIAKQLAKKYESEGVTIEHLILW